MCTLASLARLIGAQNHLCPHENRTRDNGIDLFSSLDPISQLFDGPVFLVITGVRKRQTGNIRQRLPLPSLLATWEQSKPLQLLISSCGLILNTPGHSLQIHSDSTRMDFT